MVSFFLPSLPELIIGYLGTVRAGLTVHVVNAMLKEKEVAYIVDRKKDMINVGGEKVFPSEVEDMMLAHPKIKDLVIVGIPDDLKGEAPQAFVQIQDGETATEQEIRAYCKAEMAPYKVPVAVEFIEEVPRSASGKALRRMLRDKEWG